MRIFLASFLLLLSACTVVPSSVHEGQAFGFQGIVTDSLEVDATVPGFGTSTSDVEDVAAFGVHYEAFNSESTSILMGLTRREYDDADSTELSVGARMYLIPDSNIQPFLQGAFAGSSGWEDNGIESDAYFSAGVGAGAAWFFSPNSSAEFGLRYDTSVVAPEFEDPIFGTTEKALRGTTRWVGISFYF